MILDIILLLVGIALILGGANFLTDGASAIAKRFGISDLVIGLTVVAFGTSAPELSISLISALGGSSGMAIGNVVGSNIFNILVIIGITALVSPIKIQKSIMTNEIPLVILASIAIMAIGSSLWLDGSEPIVSRIDGILLLLFFIIFMRYTFSQAKNASPEDPATPSLKAIPVWLSIVYVLGGLAALVYGGDIFVDSASSLALAMGISETVIGLTIVAAGTSMPELATSVTAAIKGKTEIAIGNVIGSNIFNIFAILGITATICPLPFQGIGMVDMFTLVGSAFIFWLTGWVIKERTITRTEGAFMVACFIAYTAFLITNGQS